MVEVTDGRIIEPAEQHTGDCATDNDGQEDEQSVKPGETFQRIRRE